ncbi:hypothetical protein [Vibrio pectenicida]|uniref:Uncharacterized protein n=1 Tax=Vibrio pectenicida TaxID=62763 RepID=A0A3R9EJ87_9VIBR|nr:hypothetical protein [Vibrio pectenicida]RSD31693.1 hypothetical protein EJA03_07630 [Vibrio pectenicida]
MKTDRKVGNYGDTHHIDTELINSEKNCVTNQVMGANVLLAGLLGLLAALRQCQFSAEPNKYNTRN